MECQIILYKDGIKHKQVKAISILINKFNFSFMIYNYYDEVNYESGTAKTPQKLNINKIKRTEDFLIHISKLSDGGEIDTFFLYSLSYIQELRFTKNLSEEFFSKVHVSRYTRRKIKDLLKYGKIRKKNNYIYSEEDRSEADRILSYSKNQIKNISSYHGRKK